MMKEEINQILRDGEIANLKREVEYVKNNAADGCLTMFAICLVVATLFWLDFRISLIEKHLGFGKKANMEQIQ